MSEWLSYRPEDLLLFSPRVYWRMFELHNAQLWPLHLLTLAAGLALGVLVWQQRRGHAHWVALVLAALWIFIGWSFLWSRYASINWAIAYVAPAFGLEALLLTIVGTRLSFDRQDVAARLGLLIAGLGVVLYPLLPLLFGRSWTEAEVFGIAPDPTAIATLGILLPAQGRLALLLFPVPIAWLVLSGLTLRTMGEQQGGIPLLAAGAVITLLSLRLLNRWRTS
jgi:hypothetical protein